MNAAWRATVVAAILGYGNGSSAQEPAAPEISDDGAASLEASADSLATIPVNPAAAAPPLPSEQPQAEVGSIDTVIVTAQRREENVIDVPISVQVFSGESLAASGIDSTQELGRVVPGLRYSSVSAFPIIFIRGLGTDTFIPSADPSIAAYVDGFYLPAFAATLQSLANVERVEVLKGPQGTLFGRNATGGAISVVTAEPGDEFTGSFDAQAGDFNERAFRGSFSGPITSWLSASLSGQTSRRDPYYDEINHDPGPDKLDAARLKLRFELSENISLGLSGYRSDQAGQSYLVYKNTDPSLLGRAAGIQPAQDNYVGENDFPSTSDVQQTLAFGTLNWALPAFDVKLLASDQQFEGIGSLDFDGSPSALAAITSDNIFYDLQSGELQLLSNDDSWGSEHFTWVAGLYYLRSSAGLEPAILRVAPGFASAALAATGVSALAQLGDTLETILDTAGLSQTPLGSGGLAIRSSGTLATRSGSAYAQGTYTFTDWLDLTLGGRLQHERRFLTNARSELSTPDGGIGPTLLPFQPQGERETRFAPKAVLTLRPFDQGIVYLSYSTAHKSGTYNVINISQQPTYLKPERVESFEIGTKLEFANGLLRFDAALFHSNIDNLQSGFAGLLSGGVVQLFSVDRARSRGAEIAVSWMPMPEWNPGLTLGLNGAWIDAIYQDFQNGPGYAQTTGLYRNDFDHSGNRITHTPEWSGTIGLTQHVTLGNGALELGIDDNYNSKTFSAAQNAREQEAYAVLNARIGYVYTPWKLRLTFVGQNLLDRRYHYIVGPTDFGSVKTLAAPREFGVRLGWVF